jgi:glycosyltransferase involved in cell wall biosynthesis
MCCQVPVVGSASGEIPNVIDHTGVVFAEGDIDGLAQQLDELLRDDERRALLGKRARDRVLREFTQARIAQRFYDVYCSTLPECREAQQERSADQA